MLSIKKKTIRSVVINAALMNSIYTMPNTQMFVIIFLLFYLLKQLSQQIIVYYIVMFTGHTDEYCACVVLEKYEENIEGHCGTGQVKWVLCTYTYNDFRFVIFDNKTM